MTNEGYEALRAAVTLARTDGCRSAANLKARLISQYGEDATQEAIQCWANYEASKDAAALAAAPPPSPLDSHQEQK